MPFFSEQLRLLQAAPKGDEKCKNNVVNDDIEDEREAIIAHLQNRLKITAEEHETFIDKRKSTMSKTRIFPSNRNILLTKEFSREKLSYSKSRIFPVKSQCLLTKEFSREKLSDSKSRIFPRQIAMFI